MMIFLAVFLVALFLFVAFQTGFYFWRWQVRQKHPEKYRQWIYDTLFRGGVVACLVALMLQCTFAPPKWRCRPGRRGQ